MKTVHLVDYTSIERRRELVEESLKVDIWSILYAAQNGKFQRMETLLKRHPEQINEPHAVRTIFVNK